MKDDKRSGAKPLVIGFVVVFLPVLYFLSAGPVRWLIKNGDVPQEAYAVYSPIFWLCDYCQPLADLTHWYIDYWR